MRSQRWASPVYTSDPHTVRRHARFLGRMADLMGATQQGADVVAALAAAARRAARAPRGPAAGARAVRGVADPLITIGQNTFIADALRWAGAESVVLSKQNWPQMSFEEVVRLQPDYIVLRRTITEANAARSLRICARAPVWRDLQAVRNRARGRA